MLYVRYMSLMANIKAAACSVVQKSGRSQDMFQNFRESSRRLLPERMHYNPFRGLDYEFGLVHIPMLYLHDFLNDGSERRYPIEETPLQIKASAYDRHVLKVHSLRTGTYRVVYYNESSLDNAREPRID